MEFTLPDGTRFEIPDEWWKAAGMDRFVRRSSAYRYRADEKFPELVVTLIPLAAMKPVHRQVPIDFGGFSRDRMERVLRWIASDTPTEPVRARAINDSRYGFELHDGFHRYYASAAAGFPDIPIVAQSGYFEPLF